MDAKEATHILRSLLNMGVVKLSLSSQEIALAEQALQTLSPPPTKPIPATKPPVP